MWRILNIYINQQATFIHKTMALSNYIKISSGDHNRFNSYVQQMDYCYSPSGSGSWIQTVTGWDYCEILEDIGASVLWAPVVAFKGATESWLQVVDVNLSSLLCGTPHSVFPTILPEVDGYIEHIHYWESSVQHKDRTFLCVPVIDSISLVDLDKYNPARLRGGATKD